MSRPLWFVDLLKKAFPGRYLFARLTRFPLAGPLVDSALFKGDDIIYLPRDGLIRVNEPINEVEEVVLPSKVVEYFINQASLHWIMDFCICRSSETCKEYPIDYGCLFIREAVTQINPGLGRLVSRNEALDHVGRCRDAGLVHMIGRNKIDTIWLGAGPGNRLLTVCNCCPCCCLWKMLPDLDPTISRKISRMPGVTITVKEICNGCQVCIEDVCFVEAISMNGDRAQIDQSRCRGCGRCLETCPFEAIDSVIEPAAVVNSAIDRITPLVDI